jgi:cytochrome c-type biogenesis protein CcmH/NrfG
MPPFPGEEERQEFYRAGKLFDAGDYAEAASVWNAMVQLYPFEAMLHFVLGRCMHAQRAFDEAKVYFTTAIELNPEFWQAHYYIGSILLEQAQYREAIKVLYHLLTQQPNDGSAWTLLGGALSKIGEQQDAIDCCQQALKLNPDDTAAMHNLAFAYSAKNDNREALKWIDAALCLQPDVPAFHMHRASLLLRIGRYSEGWREWEWRLRKEEFRSLNLRSAQPAHWNGEELGGRTILVWCEQGLGDTIQFVRYLQLVKDRGARVLFECQDELQPIIENVEGVDVLFQRFAECPERFDYHVPLASLPLHFATSPQTIPAAAGYLDPETMKQFAGRFSFARGTLKIGLAWEGSRLNPANHYRSCTPEAYAPLFDVPQCSFYSLQHDADRRLLPAAIGNLGVTSMAELAGAIASLDLIITIDTSVAHLAGAMGKEVWLLLSALPDWRWELGAQTTPWYASMRIIRQEKLGEWQPVMNAAVEKLHSHILLEQHDHH